MRYRYCPICGSLLDHKNASLLKCTLCGYRFYQNSKLTANAVIIRRTGGKRQVLLVRRGIEPFKGHWDLPGGFLHNGEDPVTGLNREIREELDLGLTGARLLTTFVESYPGEDIPEEARFTLCLFYLTELSDAGGGGAGDRLEARDDITEAGWFYLDALPEDLAFQGNRVALRRLATEAG